MVVPTFFDRRSFSARDRFTRIGGGSLGAKAGGLARVEESLRTGLVPAFDPAIRIEIPLLTVIGTDWFDRFLDESGLGVTASGLLTDTEVRATFRRSSLPAELSADLDAFLAHIRAPIAVRSSSLLEESATQPFARVYETRVVPNNQAERGVRLLALEQAIKDVYASVFLERARTRLLATGRAVTDEKMAVAIQEMVGTRRNGRFYPEVSGVASTWNFYPTGVSRPEDGVVELALGLRNTTVEDTPTWAFSPACPHANPPYSTVGDLLECTQKIFWAIDLGARIGDIRNHEARCLKEYPLSDAERDGALRLIASTYDVDDDRIVVGVSRAGPRLLDFAPILKAACLPLAALLKELLAVCRGAIGQSVEIDFAMTLGGERGVPARLGVLQVRPMLVAHPEVEVRPDELPRDKVLVVSASALGNSVIDCIRDVVYVKPASFTPTATRSIGLELEAINHRLAADGRPYVLIGFGRWGSSDPSAGIPVDVGRLSGARVVVESTSQAIDVMFSQGSHFFQNIRRRKVLYFTVGHGVGRGVDWEWLDACQAAAETGFVRHVRLVRPLLVKVDGRTGRGMIAKETAERAPCV